MASDEFDAGFTEAWTDEGQNSTDEATAEEKRTTMVLVYVQVLLSPLVFVGNLLILVAIRSSKSMKKVTYLFLGHLAVADLLFGVSMWLRFFLIITDALEKYPCMLLQSCVITAGGAGQTGILYLSLEGYLSVKYFMSFKRVFTPRLAWSMICGCWAMWSAFALLSVVLAVNSPVEKAACYLGGGYYESWYLITLATIYFTHLILVVYYQVGTLSNTRRHFMQLASKPAAGQNRRAGATGAPDWTQRRRLNRLSNLSCLVGGVLVVFFVCWTPGQAGLYFFATCTRNCSELGAILLNLASLIVVSSFINVVIYGIKSPEFRRGFRRALCGPCGQVSPQDVSVISRGPSSLTQTQNLVQETSQPTPGTVAPLRNATSGVLQTDSKALTTPHR